MFFIIGFVVSGLMLLRFSMVVLFVMILMRLLCDVYFCVLSGLVWIVLYVVVMFGEYVSDRLSWFDSGLVGVIEILLGFGFR